VSRKLLKSAAVVGQMTLLSRISGFLRDIAVAYAFGAGAAADAFFVAFRIPNLFRRFFAEGAFAQAFVPVLAEYRERDLAEAHALVARMAGALGVAVTLLSLLGALAAPALVWVFAPGFADEAERFGLTTAMLRVTFPYLAFISMTALAGGVLNTWGRFAVPALTPVLLNLSLITAALVVAPRLAEPVMALAWGVFAAGILQLAVQLPVLARLGLLAAPRLDPRHPGVRQVARLMVPALFGASVTQLNIMIDTLIASFLVAGSVSWLYYSDRLMEFPLGIFSIALATVILPGLAARHSRGEHAAFARTLDWSLRLTSAVVLPAAIGLFALAGPLICTLFYYGEMTARDVVMAEASLRAYALGLVGFSFVKVLAPGFFSRQDTRTPVKVGLVAMLANLALNLALVGPLAHAGLALATALAACLNAALLLRLLLAGGVLVPGPGWPVLLLRLVLAGAAMWLLLAWQLPPLDTWLGWSAWQRAGGIAAAVAAGILSYGAAGFALGLRPADLREAAAAQGAP